MTSSRSGALTLSGLGSFTVGGRRIEVQGAPAQQIALSEQLSYRRDPNGLYAIEQAYVQYFLPEDPRPLPVVFVHGGGMTGACWETTPDGRPGWLQHFLRRGYSCYVIDNVERGRAGWCPFPQLWPEPAHMRSERDTWAFYRIGSPENYQQRVPHPGSRFPHQHLDALLRQHVPRWTTNGEPSLEALTELLGRVGPCIVIAHSQGGAFAATAAMRARCQVEALVLIEPSALPDLTRFSDAPCCRQLLVTGDYIDHSPVWAEARERWQAYVDHAAARGVDIDYLDLPAAGHPGNSHLPMADTTSDDVAGLLERWLTLAEPTR